MVAPEEITASLVHGFEFRDPLLPNRLTYAPNLGFLTLRDEARGEDGLVTVFGFVTHANRGTETDAAYPITRRAELPPELRDSADALGKGPYSRVYNAEEARAGFPYTDPAFADGLYALRFDPDKRLDMRDHTVMGGLGRMITHAKRMRVAGRDGIDTMLEQVDLSYGDVQTVLINQPPNAKRRQLQQRQLLPRGVRGQFLMPRDPSLAMSLVAERSR